MKTLFPYQTLFGDVTASVHQVTIENERVNDRIEVDQRMVDLKRVERKDWETATISIVVRATAAEIAQANDPVCVAVLNCGPTNNRVSALLAPDPTNTGVWRGDLQLDRPYWYSQAILRCGVVASVEGQSNRIIGWADTWTISFDDLPNWPINGAIKITWVDFNFPDEDKKYLRRHAENYMYLSLDQDEPQVFLNKGFDGLEQLLTDRKRRAADRALNDQTRAAIADKTWTALFNTALSAVEELTEYDPKTGELRKTGEPQWPDTNWQRTVLEALLPDMYPDKDSDEALKEAWSDRNTPDSPGTLQEHLAVATTVQSKANRLLRDSIRAMSNELGADEQEID